MVNEGEPPQGGHQFDFGSGPQDPPPPPPPAPPAPPSGPPQPEPDPQPEPVPLPGPLQPEPVRPEPQPEPSPPGTPEQVPPVQASAAPGEPDGAQPTEAYPAQPFPAPAAPAYPGAGPGHPGGSAPQSPAPPEAFGYGQPAPYGQPGPQYGAPQPAPYGAQPGPTYPAQPYGAQPGQPYGAQPGPYPEQAYGGQPGGPKKSSKGLLWGLIGGGAVALIAIALVVALLVVPAITRSSVTAADAVKGYLTAVSKSDAKTALGYLDGSFGKDLLTDAVLKESNKLAPISHITVKQRTSGSTVGDVSATFSVGGKTVTTTYQAYKVKDDWKITNGVQLVSFDSLKGLGASVNGVSTANLTEPYVFPGTYRLTLPSKYFSFKGDSTFTIVGANDATALYEVQVALNDTGVKEYRSLVRTAVEACVAMKTLSTPCGMDITGINLSGATPVEGTVTRTLTAEGSAALDALQPEVSGSAPTVVSTYDSISVDTTLQGSDGQTYSVTLGGNLDTPTVDFGAADPKVVWEK